MHATSSVVVDIVRLRVISVQNDCFLPEAERPRGGGGRGRDARTPCRAWRVGRVLFWTAHDCAHDARPFQQIVLLYTPLSPSTCSLRIRAIRFFHIGDDANRLVRAFVQLQGFCCTCRHSRRLGRQARHALVHARWRRTEDVWVAWA